MCECAELKAALAAARAEVERLEGELAQYREVPSAEWEGFASAMNASRAQVDALAGALAEARRGMDMVHTGLMDPTRPRQSVGEVAFHWLNKTTAALALHRPGSAKGGETDV